MVKYLIYPENAYKRRHYSQDIVTPLFVLQWSS